MDKKIAIVTGAAGGIGRSIVGQLIKDNLHVIAFDMNKNGLGNLEKQFLINVHPHLVDLTNYDEIKKAFLIIESEYGGIDVLVNNAGITKDMLSLKMKNEDFFAVVNTNLGGTFNISQLVVKKMMRAKTGSIINISIVIGITGNAGQVNYAASKAGIIAMTKSYAKEYGKKNVRFNAIAPGFIETDMTSELPDAIKENILNNVALNRFGQPEEVANVAYFLGSDESSFVNGQTIVVDGMMI